MQANSSPPETLTSDRLTLRLPHPDMAQALSAFHQRNASYFAAYTPLRPAEHHSETAWRRRAAGQLELSQAGKAVHWVISETPKQSVVIGSISFTAIQRGVLQAAYLGYQLDREHVGRGLMTEALKVALADAFQRMNLHRVMANYVPTNERSARVLKRLDFVVEGYARDYLLLDGVWKDHILTSLTNPNWREA